MAIEKVIIQNFKKFKEPFEINFNENINLLVGDNESGKSTILEAIHVALTGVYAGRSIRNQLSAYLFNREAVQEYLESVESGHPTAPPQIMIEIYFKSGTLPEYEGNGNSENKYSVKINNFEINLLKGVPKFQNYDTIETSKKLKLFSDFYLPIEIHQKTYQEYEEQEITYSIEEAKKFGITQVDESLKEQIEGKQVTNKKINAEQIGANIEVEVIYEVLESIGTKEKIVF